MSDAPASAKFADLKSRVLTGVLLGLLAMGAIWAGGIWTLILITLGTALMLVEQAAITGAKAGQVDTAAASIWALPAVALPASFLFLTVPQGLIVGAVLIAAIALIDLMARRAQGMAFRIPTASYILAAGLAFLWIRHLPDWGLMTAIWVALVVAGTDVGGYFAGRIIGGPKLWPAVSKGKTWAGFFGGIALAMLVGLLFSWATTGTYGPQVCVISAIAALLSQAGDLAESSVKRRFAVKDSGALLPGHGGLLDRCDGLMAATLVAAIVTFWRGQPVFIW